MATSSLMQWSHETMCAIVIFKICRQLLDPVGGLLSPKRPGSTPPSISEPTTVFYKHSGIFTREHYSPQISLHSNNQFAHVVHKQNSIRLAISVWHVYTQECDNFSPWSF